MRVGAWMFVRWESGWRGGEGVNFDVRCYIVLSRAMSIARNESARGLRLPASETFQKSLRTQQSKIRKTETKMQKRSEAELN